MHSAGQPSLGLPVFGAASGDLAPAREPDEIIPKTFRRKFAGNNWVGPLEDQRKEFPKTDPILLHANKKY